MRKVVFIHAAGRLAEGSGPLVAYLEDERGAGFQVTVPEMPNRPDRDQDVRLARDLRALRARPRMSRSDTQAPD